MAETTDFTTMVENAAAQAAEAALAWASSPAGWGQLALLVVAFLLARFLAARLAPLLRRFCTAEGNSLLAQARQQLGRALPLLTPLLAFGMIAAGEELARQTLGASGLLDFGKRLALLLAAHIFVRKVLHDPFLRFLGRWVLLPVMLLYTLGLLDDASAQLEKSVITVSSSRALASSKRPSV